LEGARPFVVQALEFGVETCSTKLGMATLVGFQYGISMVCLGCFCEDGVAVIIVND